MTKIPTPPAASSIASEMAHIRHDTPAGHVTTPGQPIPRGPGLATEQGNVGHGTEAMSAEAMARQAREWGPGKHRPSPMGVDQLRSAPDSVPVASAGELRARSRATWPGS